MLRSGGSLSVVSAEFVETFNFQVLGTGAVL